MPNPWDVGSARLLATCGFEALATTSAGFAWALGKHDQTVTRDELVAHVTELAAATELPLNVDSERCYPDDPGGVRRDGGAACRGRRRGFLDRGLRPGRRRAMDEISVAAERVAVAAEASRRLARADGADRPRREPHSRRRRPRRHDRAAASPIATPVPTRSTRPVSSDLRADRMPSSPRSRSR